MEKTEEEKLNEYMQQCESAREEIKVMMKKYSANAMLHVLLTAVIALFRSVNAALSNDDSVKSACVAVHSLVDEFGRDIENYEKGEQSN